MVIRADNQISDEQAAVIRDFTRRRFLKLVVFSAGAAGLAACGSGSGSASPLASVLSGSAAPTLPPTLAPSAQLATTVRATQFVETSSYVLAKAKGWYEQATGASFTWTEVQGGAAIMTLLGGNSLDVGFGIGGRPVIAGIVNNVPFKLVGLIGSSPPTNVLVHEDSGITEAAQLVGKRVGVGFATNAQLLLFAWLKQQNVSASDLHLLDLDVNPMVAAWQRGDIDAAVTFDPATTAIEKAGGTPVAAFLSDLKTAGVSLNDQIIVAESFVANYPDSVVGILRAVAHAVDYWNANLSDTASTLAAAVGISVADAMTQMSTYKFFTPQEALSPEQLGAPGQPGAYAQGLKNLSDSMVEMKLIPASVPLEQFAARIDTTALAKAATMPWTS